MFTRAYEHKLKVSYTLQKKKEQAGDWSGRNERYRVMHLFLLFVLQTFLRPLIFVLVGYAILNDFSYLFGAKFTDRKFHW